jgi:hypothetical protein
LRNACATYGGLNRERRARLEQRLNLNSRAAHASAIRNCGAARFRVAFALMVISKLLCSFRQLRFSLTKFRTRGSLRDQRVGKRTAVRRRRRRLQNAETWSAWRCKSATGSSTTIILGSEGRVFERRFKSGAEECQRQFRAAVPCRIRHAGTDAAHVLPEGMDCAA